MSMVPFFPKHLRTALPYETDDVEGASDAHSAGCSLTTIKVFHTSTIFVADTGLYTLIAFCCLVLIKVQHKYTTKKLQLYIGGVDNAYKT